MQFFFKLEDDSVEGMAYIFFLSKTILQGNL